MSRMQSGAAQSEPPPFKLGVALGDVKLQRLDLSEETRRLELVHHIGNR